MLLGGQGVPTVPCLMSVCGCWMLWDCLVITAAALAALHSSVFPPAAAAAAAAAAANAAAAALVLQPRVSCSISGTRWRHANAQGAARMRACACAFFAAPAGGGRLYHCRKQLPVCLFSGGRAVCTIICPCACAFCPHARHKRRVARCCVRGVDRAPVDPRQPPNPRALLLLALLARLPCLWLRPCARALLCMCMCVRARLGVARMLV